MKSLKTLLNAGFVIDHWVRDHCNISGKYRGSAHRDRNINVKLNRKVLIVFHNLKIYDSHLIIQELSKSKNQESDNKVLDWLWQKKIILMNIWAIFKSLNKNYEEKKGFIVTWLVKKINDKENDHVLKVWDKFEMKKKLEIITACT